MKRGSGTLIPIEIQPPDPSVRRGLWPVQPVPAATESLSSWLGRTALGNGLAPADVLAELRRLRVRTHLLDADMNLPAKAATAIGRWTGHSTAVLAGMTLSGNAALLALPLATQAQAGRPAPRHQYCPACLAEDREPYFRLLWSVCWVVSCLIHKCLLVSGCPRCGAGSQTMDIQCHLRDLAQCAVCGADFRTAARTRAARKILDGQALIDVLHVILLRIGNPVWVKRFAQLMANLPNTMHGYSERPAATGRFDAMPLRERASYIGKSSDRGVMRRLMEVAGGEALVGMLPDHIARICPDAAGDLSSGTGDPSPPRRDLPSLLEVLRAYDALSAVTEPLLELTAVPARRHDASQLAEIHRRIIGGTGGGGRPLPHQEIDEVERQFAALLVQPHSRIFFLAAQKRRVGWALLTGNILMSLVLIPEWRHAYENALRTLQAAADPWLRDHAFTVMVVRVSEWRRQCFEDAGWRRATEVVDGIACDWPDQLSADVPVHTLERVIGGRPTLS